MRNRRDRSRTAFGYLDFIIPFLQDNDITKNINANNYPVVQPRVRSLSIGNSSKPDIIVQSLAKTSKSAWGKIGAPTKNIKKDANDLVGPLDVALTIENSTTNARIVVFGDSEFVSDIWLNETGAYGNISIFINSIKWLAERKEPININAKQLKLDTFPLTENQTYTILGIIVLIPIISIAFGIFIWVRRKNL